MRVQEGEREGEKEVGNTVEEMGLGAQSRSHARVPQLQFSRFERLFSICFLPVLYRTGVRYRVQSSCTRWSQLKKEVKP